MGGGRQTEKERERERGTDRQTENLNSKTLFYKDCSSGSVKACVTTSPCLANDK